MIFMIVKIPCRFILIGGGGSIGGRSGAIARRQKMITTLHISEWIEPNEDLFVSVTKSEFTSSSCKYNILLYLPQSGPDYKTQ